MTDRSLGDRSQLGGSVHRSRPPFHITYLSEPTCARAHARTCSEGVPAAPRPGGQGQRLEVETEVGAPHRGAFKDAYLVADLEGGRQATLAEVPPRRCLRLSDVRRDVVAGLLRAGCRAAGGLLTVCTVEGVFVR